MTPEESARASIDALLVAASWTIQTHDTINLSAASRVALSEAITQNGEADWLLIACGKTNSFPL